MKNLNKLILFVALSLVYTSCSENTDPEINQQEATLSLYKSTLNQGEVGLILSDQSIASISATLNSENMPLTSTSEGYGFVVPVDLAMGSYTLNITADEKVVDFTLTIRETENIPDPDQYINKTLQDINTQVTDAGEIKSKLPANEQASFQNDIETINGWIDQYKTAYDALTPEQKLVAAKTIEANKQNLEDLSTAIDNLNASTLKLKKAELDNHEDIIEDAMEEYTLAVISVARSTAIAAILTSTGFLTFGPLGAAIGGGIGVGIVALNFKRLSAAQSVLMNNTFLPFENLLAKFKKSTLEFNNDEYTKISISANYRSVNNGDLNSQTPIVNNFVSNALKAKEIWDDLMKKLNVTMAYAAKDITEVTATNTTNRDIHSSNLEIQNVSSPNISYDVDRSEGRFSIKFNSSEDYDEDFTFDLVYSNEKFGYLKQKVDAKYIAVFSPKGTWNFSVNGMNVSLDLNSSNVVFNSTEGWGEYTGSWTYNNEPNNAIVTISVSKIDTVCFGQATVSDNLYFDLLKNNSDQLEGTVETRIGAYSGDSCTVEAQYFKDPIVLFRP
ncbi:MAG: hypothetical protein ACI8UQ_001517 [Bacteroidia bacterium]|jgi:hypothetical protein